MAYHDENGRITIDEVAAYNDIAKLQNSIDIMRTTMRKFEQLQAEAAESSGKTAAAIANKAAEMIGKLRKAISQLENSIALIKRTVAYYQQKDRELRDTINGSW